MLTDAAMLLEEAALHREAAQVESLAARALQEMGRFDEAWERAARAWAAVNDGTEDEAVAEVGARRSALAFMRGDHDAALADAETALRIADGLRLSRVLALALITKANVLAEVGRPGESTALLTYAVKLAVDHDLGDQVGRAYYNLADNVMAAGRFGEAEEMLTRAIELARRRGDRPDERRLLAQRLIAQGALGRWDEMLRDAAVLEERTDDIWADQTMVSLPIVLAARGDVEGLDAVRSRLGDTGGWDAVELAQKIGRAVVARERGESKEGFEDAYEAAIELVRGSTSEAPPLFAEAVECAFAAGELDRVEQLIRAVDGFKPAQLLPLLDAEVTRARARLAAHKGDLQTADELFRRAVALFKELETPFYLARAQLEYAELLARAGTNGAELREEATLVFGALDAKPWLDRAGQLERVVAA
jgi:tetratricopeptide (TPR) repeat protein